jgi:hypothetical protein
LSEKDLVRFYRLLPRKEDSPVFNELPGIKEPLCHPKPAKKLRTLCGCFTQNYLQEKNPHYDVYQHLNYHRNLPIRPGVTISSEDILAVGSFAVDLDGNLEAARLNLKEIGLPEPSRVIISGGGDDRGWLFWDLAEPNFDLQPYFRGVQLALAFALNGDPRCRDLARVARVPGFINHKKGCYSGLISKGPLLYDPMILIEPLISAFGLKNISDLLYMENAYQPKKGHSLYQDMLITLRKLGWSTHGLTLLFLEEGTDVNELTKLPTNDIKKFMIHDNVLPPPEGARKTNNLNSSASQNGWTPSKHVLGPKLRKALALGIAPGETRNEFSKRIIQLSQYYRLTKEQVLNPYLESIARFPERSKEALAGNWKYISSNFDQTWDAWEKHVAGSPHLYPCCKCGELKPAGEFYADKRRWTGLNSFCKDCDKKRRSESRRKTEAAAKQAALQAPIITNAKEVLEKVGIVDPGANESVYYDVGSNGVEIENWDSEDVVVDPNNLKGNHITI